MPARKIHFGEYKVQDVDSVIANMIKDHNTIMDAMQTVAFNIAAEIEADMTVGCQKLTDFVIGISSVDDDGSIAFPTDARQFLRYMNAVLPVKWKGKHTLETFSVQPEADRVKGFRYGTALKAMQATRWDKYGEKAKSAEFDADKTIGKIIGMVNSLIKHHDDGDLADDDPAYMKARKLKTVLAA